MIHSQDLVHMDRALALAERGRGRTSPNPMVGAVVVSPDGRVLGSGYHERAGGAHAEIRALNAVAERDRRSATLYCTLEPCCHVGRTGPCVERIEADGIARVVAAVEDPNPLVAGKGFAHLRAHGILVDVGARQRAATLQNRAFLTFVRAGRPFVILKAALSADGCLAAAPGVRTAITSEASLRHAHLMRAEIDAIGIGSETLLVDDPLLTVRHVYRARPLVRVVFDRRLRIGPGARLFSTIGMGPVIICTSDVAAARQPERARALAAAGATIEPCEGLEQALPRLAHHGITSLLVEGGARLHEAVWDGGFVDYVQVYTAPIRLGPGIRFLSGRRFSLAALADGRTIACGPDVLVEGYVHRLD